MVSTKGTLLAICDGRKCNTIDYRHINLVCKRSFDNGGTWEPMELLWDGRANTAGNPAPVVDQQTGTIWLLWVKTNTDLFAMKSTDDGETWSKPKALIDNKNWLRVGTGPCHGIQIGNGRLITPCWTRVAAGPHPINYSQIIYNNDHGRTWQIGAPVGPYMNEAVAVELDGGKVYLNMLNYTHLREFAVSRDGGESFGELEHDPIHLPGSRRQDSDPLCQSCLPGKAVRLFQTVHYDSAG